MIPNIDSKNGVGDSKKLPSNDELEEIIDIVLNMYPPLDMGGYGDSLLDRDIAYDQLADVIKRICLDIIGEDEMFEGGDKVFFSEQQLIRTNLKREQRSRLDRHD